MANFPITFNRIFPINYFTLFLMSFTMASSAEQTTAESQDTSCSNTVCSETLTTQLATNVGNETKPQNKDNTITTLSAAISKVEKHMNQEGLEGSHWQKFTKIIPSALQGTSHKAEKAAKQCFHESFTKMSTATKKLASFNAERSHQSHGPNMHDLVSEEVAAESYTASSLTTPDQMRVKRVRDVRKQWEAVKTAAGVDSVKTSIEQWPKEVKEQYDSLGKLVAEL